MSEQGSVPEHGSAHGHHRHPGDSGQPPAIRSLNVITPDSAEGPMPLTDLAADHPKSRFDRALQWVPRILSSKPHIVVLMLLGFYLIVLPLLGVAVSAKTELIGGNYTNVTSDIGACIAAGGTLTLVNQSRKRAKVDADRLRMLTEVHSLLHHVHADAAAELGQPASLTPPMPPASQ
jgi:hypothetical protein